MSGAGTRSVWEDVTATTPLATSATTATFSSLVSAQFWLLRLPTWMAVDKIPIADNIFRCTVILLLGVQSQLGFCQPTLFKLGACCCCVPELCLI